MALFRFPLVAFGFAVERLRRLPGGHTVGEYAPAIAAGLLAASLVAFVAWGAERSPQRITLAQLEAGQLSSMQSWIIISGELSQEPSQTAGFRYVLVDPAAPNASMIVASEFELPVGWTTLSGTYVGTREVAPSGFRWIGYMRAEPVPAHEQPPPWIAILLAVAGLLVGFAGRFTYPTFFDERPRGTAPRTATLRVGIRGATEATAAGIVPGTLRLRPGAWVTLQIQGAAEQPLRLHSAHTSVDVGELRRLLGSDPALRVKQAKGDIDIVFASRDERDVAFAALTADVGLQGGVGLP